MSFKKTEKKYLSIDFEIKGIIDEEDADNFTFIGYGSTFHNIDRGDDIIMPGAFKESLGKLKPRLLWQHDSREPLGVFAEIFEDAKGLYIKGKMPKSDTFVSGRVIPQMKAGSINSMSIGFSIKDSEDTVIDGRTIRKITNVTLWEVSLVSIPMNPEATITDVKELTPYEEFKKLNKVSDDAKSLVPLFEGMERIKDVSEFLKEFRFSNSEATTLISTIKRVSRNESSNRNELEVLSNLSSLLENTNKEIKEIVK